MTRKKCFDGVYDLSYWMVDSDSRSSIYEIKSAFVVKNNEISDLDGYYFGNVRSDGYAEWDGPCPQKTSPRATWSGWLRDDEKGSGTYQCDEGNGRGEWTVVKTGEVQSSENDERTYPQILTGSLSQKGILASKAGETSKEDDVIRRIDKFTKLTETCTEFKFTIFVDQPKPGHRDPYYNEDVGHTFIEISGCDESLMEGFYPEVHAAYGRKDFILGLYKKDREGEIRDDSSYGEDHTRHPSNVEKSWKITRDQAEKIKNCIKDWNSNKKYNLVKSNCTNFAIEMARCIPLKVPDSKKTSWPKPFSHVKTANPGDIGEDLVNDYGGIRITRPIHHK